MLLNLFLGTMKIEICLCIFKLKLLNDTLKQQYTIAAFKYLNQTMFSCSHCRAACSMLYCSYILYTRLVWGVIIYSVRQSCVTSFHPCRRMVTCHTMSRALRCSTSNKKWRKKADNQKWRLWQQRTVEKISEVRFRKSMRERTNIELGVQLRRYRSACSSRGNQKNLMRKCFVFEGI